MFRLAAEPNRWISVTAPLKPDQADSGAVTPIQRFGSAANLNIHLHCLVLDGVYRRTDGEPVFVEVPAPTDEALQALLHKIIGRLMKLLTRRGVLVEEEGLTYLADSDADSDDARTLRPLQAAPRGLAGRAGPVARPLARHKQSTGLFESGLGLPHCLRPTCGSEGVHGARRHAP